MNLSKIKKAAAVLAAVMTVVSVSGCGSESTETESENTASSQSSTTEDSSESEAESSEAKKTESDSSKVEEEEEELDPQFAYYSLLKKENFVFFEEQGIADGVVYYSTYDHNYNIDGYSIRALDIESGEDRELIYLPQRASFDYYNGSLYVNHSGNVEKYDLDGNMLASYSGLDLDHREIKGYSTDGHVVFFEGFLTPDLKEFKAYPPMPGEQDPYHGYIYVAGNKVYVTMSEDPMLYCFDLETESWSEINLSKYSAEGHKLSPSVYLIFGWGKYLAMQIDYGEIGEGTEDSDTLIIDTETDEVIARPQYIFAINADKSFEFDWDIYEYCFTRYPADGSDPEMLETIDGLRELVKPNNVSIFDNNRYCLVSSGSVTGEYWYVDLEAPKLQMVCYYDTADGLISAHEGEGVEEKPEGVLVPESLEGRSFRVNSYQDLNGYEQPYEYENGVYPVYTFNNGRITVEWFNANGSPADAGSHESSFLEDYEINYEFVKTDGGYLFSTNHQEAVAQYFKDNNQSGYSSLGAIGYSEYWGYWTINDRVFYDGAVVGILTPIDG